MSSLRKTFIALVALAALLLAACGSSDDAAEVASAAAEDTASSSSAAEDEEHSDDEDHGDEDHDDEHDHDDEEHKDDEDHDHDDEDHDDEEHDHDDEDHDDEEHDHDDEDHDDEEHDHDDEEHKDDEEHDHDHDHDHDDESASGLGAHEHGVAELTVAWSGGDMVIDLVSPTYNIFGFEREAETDEEIAVVEDRTSALTAPGVISINDEAGCTLTDDPTTELEFEGSHAEIIASWLLTCENPDEINQLDASGLFAEFPNLEDLDTQWASDAGQSSAELSPSSTTVDLS